MEPDSRLLKRIDGAGEKVAPLKEYVRARAHESVPLLPNVPKQSDARRRKARRNEDWKLYINAEVEPAL